MSWGVLLDFLESMLPMIGVTDLKMLLQGTNSMIVFAIVIGFVVRLLIPAALLLRRARRIATYHSIITVIQVAWFIDHRALLFCMYKFPLLPSGS